MLEMKELLLIYDFISEARMKTFFCWIDQDRSFILLQERKKSPFCILMIKTKQVVVLIVNPVCP